MIGQCWIGLFAGVSIDVIGLSDLLIGPPPASPDGVRESCIVAEAATMEPLPHRGFVEPEQKSLMIADWFVFEAMVWFAPPRARRHHTTISCATRDLGCSCLACTILLA